MANSELVSNLEDMRYNNIPIFTIVFFFNFFLRRENEKQKMFYLMFFGGMIIGSQNRSMILGVAMSCILYTLLKYKKKIVEKKTIVILILIGVLSSGILAYRFSTKGSTGQGISSELELAYDMYSSNSYRLYDNQMIYSEGTLAFRFAMIFERVDYLIRRPLSFIFGAGCYHEKSNAKKLPFRIGSGTEDGTAKVDTNDVALLSRFFRYGFLFVLLYVLFICKSINVSFNNYSLLSQVFLLIMISYVFWSICGDVFHYPQYFIPLLFLLPQTILYKKDFL